MQREEAGEGREPRRATPGRVTKRALGRGQRWPGMEGTAGASHDLGLQSGHWPALRAARGITVLTDASTGPRKPDAPNKGTLAFCCRLVRSHHVLGPFQLKPGHLTYLKTPDLP